MGRAVTSGPAGHDQLLVKVQVTGIGVLRHRAHGTIPGAVSRMSPKNCPICSLVRHMPRPNASSMTSSSAAESGSPRVRK